MEEVSPRERVLKNSNRFSDFRIRTIKTAPYGRKEIEMAEQGLLNLTHKFYENVHKNIKTSVVFAIMLWCALIRDAGTDVVETQDVCLHWRQASEGS